MIYRSGQNIKNYRNSETVFQDPRHYFQKVLSPSDVSLSSLLSLQVYKASDYPLFTVATDYFAIMGTDHAIGNGGIIWGECDDRYLTNFVEKGTILSEYQSETPFLIKITTAESGLQSDEYFLYYHTDTSDPDNASKQQTHLLTTSGGAAPHLCTWTQRGKVLGIVVANSENHTGYLNVVKRGVGDYIGTHTTRSGTGNWSSSTSDDGINWTRGSLLDFEANIPVGYHCGSSVFPFTFNNTSYVVTSFWHDTDPSGLAIWTHDTDYRPDGLAQIMYYFDYTQRGITVSHEGDKLYIFSKKSASNSDNLSAYNVRSYDLNVLL